MMSAKGVARKKREARKHEILEVALALFSEAGFHGVSMQKIGVGAGLSTGTLYDYFENKDSLFKELMESKRRCFRKDLFDLLDAPTEATERVRFFICSLPFLLEEYATYIKVCVMESGKVGAKVSRSEVNCFNAIFKDKLAEIIATGMSQGAFRRVDSLITAQALWTLIESLAFEMAGRFDREVAMDKFAKVKQLFVDGLLAV